MLRGLLLVAKLVIRLRVQPDAFRGPENPVVGLSVLGLASRVSRNRCVCHLLQLGIRIGDASTNAPRPKGLERVGLSHRRSDGLLLLDVVLENIAVLTELLGKLLKEDDVLLSVANPRSAIGGAALA